MANQAQCLYCFESLYASFEDREPASLAAIEALWEQYEQSKELSKFANEEYEQSVNDDEDAEQDSRPKALQIPRIKRLQSQASDSSSTATTPSSTSNTSSNSNLSASTAMTTPSVLSGISKSSEQRYPLFVTWNTLSRSGSKSLRGCIGTFEAKDLAAGLKSYALTSAFDDSRFSPIPKSLLPSLQCALTLLGSFEPCTDAMDWTLGTHGIRISFIHRGRRHGATYLPRSGWDGGAGSAARKLLRGASSTPFGMKSWEQVSDFKTVRYQGLKAKASYKDWQDWRNWVLSLDDGRDILSLA
ncbi:hypothetical protein N7526_002439 [Penicillium atrosanguineum]|nr:hypothetical protein N7526_002439 [Penicillium atrosanguineum]